MNVLKVKKLLSEYECQSLYHGLIRIILITRNVHERLKSKKLLSEYGVPEFVSRIYTDYFDYTEM